MPVKQVPLGKTGLAVSELVFGTLPAGPLQKGMAPAELGRVIARAVRGGVTLLDGAHAYRTYPHIRAALELLGPEPAGRVMVTTKSSAADPAEFRGQLEEALAALGRERVEIFYIHAARREFSVGKYGRVIEELGRLKAEGKVRLGGLATHRVSGCRAALEVAEIEVVHPLVNMAGLGLADGTREEMLAAIAELSAAGRGLIQMKSLAGGRLIEEREKALAWARRDSGCHAVAVGMVSEAEVDYNLAIFAGAHVGAELAARAELRHKRLVILGACVRCGNCVEACPQGAMSLGEERAEPDMDKCILCGYCVPGCPQFCIRIT